MKSGIGTNVSFDPRNIILSFISFVFFIFCVEPLDLLSKFVDRADFKIS